MDKNTENKIRRNFESMESKFNYHKVKLTMNALDWWWGGTEKRIPTIDEMREAVEHLFNLALEHVETVEEYINISSGGFTVEIRKDNSVVINFMVEEQDSVDYFEYE